MSKKYKSVFFDLDNTLWDFERNSEETLKIVFTDYGIKESLCTFKEFHEKYKQVNEMCWKAYREKLLTKQELIVKRFKDTFGFFAIEGIDPLKFNNDYLDEMPNQTLLVDGTIEVLDYLSIKKYRLFIITNGFSEVQYKKMKKTNIYSYFEKVFISEEVKSPKPNKEIFEHALKSTNSSKKYSLMIGDSWESDIIGAKNFGLDQIHFYPYHNKNFTLEEVGQLRDSKTNTCRINNLKEIKGIL